MKMTVVVQVSTENLAEEQFILNRFPGSWFVTTGGVGSKAGRTTFYIPVSEKENVEKALKEWKEKNDG